MARTKISEFSANPSDNTDIDGIDIAEGCAPSGINNAIRELMAQLKDMQTGASGDTFTFASLVATTADINGGTIDGAAIGGSSAAAGTFTNLAYTGTLTGGTGVINIGSGQVYKDASGNVGVGTASPSVNYKLDVAGTAIIGATGTNAKLGFKRSSDGAEQSAISVDGTSLIYNNGTGGHIWQQAGTERARIDSSGNLGLGVTPSAWSAFRALQVNRASIASFGADTYFSHNWYWSGSADTYISSDFATRYSQQSGSHRWFTAPSGTAGNTISFTQAMTLDASGNLLVGKTSASVSTAGLYLESSASAHGRINFTSTTTSTVSACAFYYSGTLVGNIASSTTATSYNTSSDYRLKENVAPMTGALTKVAQLKPCTYTWKADGSAGQGFIAHELQAVVPDCVTGEKDAVDKDGKPVYQGVDTSFLVATLTAAIQELKAEFDAYKLTHP